MNVFSSLVYTHTHIDTQTHTQNLNFLFPKGFIAGSQMFPGLGNGYGAGNIC